MQYLGFVWSQVPNFIPEFFIEKRFVEVDFYLRNEMGTMCLFVDVCDERDEKNLEHINWVRDAYGMSKIDLYPDYSEW